MAYVIQQASTTSLNTKLGVSSTFSAPGVFTSLTTSVDQGINNLKNLLLTRIGERYNQPTFGSNLTNIIFEPITDLLYEDISESIAQPVATWLPYIEITNIEITTALDDPLLEYYMRISITVIINNIETEPITIFATEAGQIIIE